MFNGWFLFFFLFFSSISRLHANLLLPVPYTLRSIANTEEERERKYSSRCMPAVFFSFSLADRLSLLNRCARSHYTRKFNENEFYAATLVWHYIFGYARAAYDVMTMVKFITEYSVRIFQCAQPKHNNVKCFDFEIGDDRIFVFLLSEWNRKQFFSFIVTCAFWALRDRQTNKKRNVDRRSVIN